MNIIPIFVPCLKQITILGGGFYYVKCRDLDPAMYIYHKGLSITTSLFSFIKFQPTL